MSYNGYTNYETCCVALWMDKELGTYLERCHIMHDAWGNTDEDEEVLTRSEQARDVLVQWLKAFVEEGAPSLGASLYGDLFNAALSKVQWLEIADQWLTEIDGYERSATQ